MDVSLFVRRLALILPLVMLASCIDDAEQLGVILVDGRPASLSVPCEGQEIASVELLDTARSDHPGGEDDVVLWRVVARRPGPEAFVTVIGQAPEGFDTTVPLAASLDADPEYTLFINGSGGGGAIVFQPGTLRADRVESATGQRTIDGFMEYADEGCGLGRLSDEAEDVGRMLRTATA